MAVKEIIRMGHPLLKKKSREVSLQEIKSTEMAEFIQDLTETMKKYSGIGIAAPQVGINKQLTLIQLPPNENEDGDNQVSGKRSSLTPKLYIIFNPQITVVDQTLQGYWEACLSIPGLIGFVERPNKVKIDYIDEKGNPQTIVLQGFLATVFQHELDHLFGILYTDKIKNPGLLSFTEEFEQFIAPKKD